MNPQSLTRIDMSEIVAANTETYKNLILSNVNDHVVRLSMMTEPYHWHYHPNSDESFLVMEGSLIVELEDQVVELLPGQLFTIPKNVKHCTKPGVSRSVNLTFESAALTTISISPPMRKDV